MLIAADATWEEIRDAAVRRPVLLLPIGAVEAHGPHLPLATDVIIAEAAARHAAAALDAREIPSIVLPPLTYTAAPFADAFPGTVSVRPETVTALVRDVLASARRYGARAVALVNAHLDPAHVRALHAACASADTGPTAVPIVFPDLTNRKWASRLSEEFQSGACHAGQFESSIVLAERPELVRESVRTTLPDNPASLSEAIRAGRATFEEAGGPRAYFGYPAKATAGEGRASVEAFGRIIVDAVMEALDGST